MDCTQVVYDSYDLCKRTTVSCLFCCSSNLHGNQHCCYEDSGRADFLVRGKTKALMMTEAACNPNRHENASDIIHFSSLLVNPFTYSFAFCCKVVLP